jgi:hypothetical protein
MIAVFAIAVVLLANGLPAPRQGVLGLDDLPQYLEALQQLPTVHAPAPSFEEIWHSESAWRGRSIVVQGTVARRFDAPADGQFPATIELWIVDAEQNPWCLVAPRPVEPATNAIPRIGQRCRFGGTFLRLVNYESEGGTRRAPLVVGPQPPTFQSSALERAGPNHVFTQRELDWAIGVGALVVVGCVLALLRSRRPHAARLPTESDPEFLDGGIDPPADERRSG